MSSTKVKPAKKPVVAPLHPPYAEMVVTAIKANTNRSGSSRQAIVKYIQENFKVADGFESHVKMALKRGVTKGLLTQPKGVGASGSFKIAKKESAEPKPKKTVVKKTVAKPKPKPAKKPAAKAKATAKPKAKTPTKKVAKAKSPVAKKAPVAAAKKAPATKKAPAAKPKTSKPKTKVAKSPKKSTK